MRPSAALHDAEDALSASWWRQSSEGDPWNTEGSARSCPQTGASSHSGGRGGSSFKQFLWKILFMKNEKLLFLKLLKHNTQWRCAIKPGN